ncbi:tannase/feruloyl esterase family alpha/beta hydrolase [Sphingobacterium oryzagri]|uniref:Tannase/feruloyl esterase family alpha/beta hydrolase n=1 Tax=Sphingobacterium oryzagri TaxID=3025669 RepID=A0ABY7WB54_9SPHI|nr:tannase/feruloyl esterase family alpha/beta hydrolase [Sphingobacterium sp. KACC 22765]WDF66874.1 tannase/feruloyl esterase family alpha/beta hydrolase [Sphingobacterium sp. KACC 22765]
MNSIKLTLILVAALSFTLESKAQSDDGTMMVAPVYKESHPVCNCSELADLKMANVVIQSASVDKKNNSCNVIALVNHPPSDDQVTIYVGLPLNGWNGRFMGTGGGGYSGGSVANLQRPLSQGFAAAATDTGHPGSDGNFVYDAKKDRLDWQQVRNNAYLGIHDMTVIGKKLVKAFYGKEAKYAYFVGGSTGGRQGLSEAQRFPKDYNGIVAFYPAINWQRFIVAELWPQVVMNEAKNYILPAKLTFITQLIVAKYGQQDAVIADPLNIQFDFDFLIGKGDGDLRITALDVDVVKAIYQGPRDHTGNSLWFGLQPGADLTALAGTKNTTPYNRPFSVADEYVKYFLFQDPNWQVANLDRKAFELIWNQSIEQYGEVFGTDNPDLSSFKDHGGKIIIAHGLNDQLIFPEGTIDYYKRVIRQMGGIKNVLDFSRLYLLPGLDHSFSGPGAKPVDQVAVIVDWVENGKAPKEIIVVPDANTANIGTTKIQYYQ